jgi:hypothetical protein
MTDRDGKWHIDKTVNIAVVAGFLGTIGSGIWFAGQITQRVAYLEHEREVTAPQADRITRVETKLDIVQSTLVEIKALVNRRNGS